MARRPAKAKTPDPIDNLALGVAADFAADKAAGKVGEIVDHDPLGVGAQAVEAAEVIPAAEMEAETQGTDYDSQHERRLARLGRIVEEAKFESGTALGDTVDVILELFKTREKPWHGMTEGQQRETVKFIQTEAKKILFKVVTVVAEEESVTISAELGSSKLTGDKFKVDLTVNSATEDTAIQLFRMSGHRVVIVSADDKRFSSARKEPGVMADQADLNFADQPRPISNVTREILTPVPEKYVGDDADLAGDDEAVVEGVPASAAEASAGDGFEEPADYVIFDTSERLFLSDDEMTWTGDVSLAGQWTKPVATANFIECDDGAGFTSVMRLGDVPPETVED